MKFLSQSQAREISAVRQSECAQSCQTWSVYFVSENFSEFCITCGACQNKNYCLTRGEKTTILSCTAPRRIFSRGLPVSKWGVLGRHRICENRLEHMFLGCYMWGLHFSGRLYFEKSNRALQVNWPIYATFGASIFWRRSFQGTVLSVPRDWQINCLANEICKHFFIFVALKRALVYTSIYKFTNWTVRVENGKSWRYRLSATATGAALATLATTAFVDSILVLLPWFLIAPRGLRVIPLACGWVRLGWRFS